MIERKDVLKGEELKKRLRGIPMQTSMYDRIHYKLVQTWCIYSDALLSISNSGASARNTMEQLDSISGTFVGLAVVLSNDTFPEKRSDKFKKDYRSDIKYLFTVSEL